MPPSVGEGLQVRVATTNLSKINDRPHCEIQEINICVTCYNEFLLMYSTREKTCRTEIDQTLSPLVWKLSYLFITSFLLSEI